MSGDEHRSGPRISFASGLVRLTIVLVFAGSFYLFARQIRRSLYASDAEYLDPVFIDSTYMMLLVMAAFAALFRLLFILERPPSGPLIADRKDDDKAIRRRRDAKRFNERLKLTAAGLNTLGTSSLAAGFLLPIVASRTAWGQSSLMGVVIAIACYVGAQLVVGLWKTEE